jgi:hypothetical protein
MPASVDTQPVSRPKRLLTQNRELKAIGVWNWTLPAWAGRSRWDEQHITLDDPAAVRLFDRAFAAGKDLIAAWDRARTFLTAEELPTSVGPDVKESLWSLARLSRQRSTMGAQLGAVVETLADVPPDAEDFQELQRRRVQIEGRLAMLVAEIDNRVEALEKLATSERVRRFRAVRRGNRRVSASDQGGRSADRVR